MGGDFLVAEVFHEEHGDFGDLAGEVFELDAIELVEADAGMVANEIELEIGVEELEGREFELAEAMVGDDEEVTAAAGGVEEGEGGDFVEEGLELGFGGNGALKLSLELVEEEGLDDFEDVFFGGVVGTEFAAFGRVHDALEHGAENGGGDEGPVEFATFEEDGAHFGIEPGGRKGFAEEGAIDVAEAAEFFGKIGHATFGRGVEDGEELEEALGEAGTVGVRGLDVVFEGAFFEDAGIVGKEAEEEADEEDFEGVAGVVFIFEGVVETGELVGGVGVELDLGAVFKVSTETGEAAKDAGVATKLGNFEGLVGVFLFEVEDADLVEIGKHEEAGGFFGLEGFEIGEGLGVGGVEGAAFGLHLDEDLAGEEKVDVVGGAIGHENLMLGGAGAPIDTKDVQEVGDELDVLLFFVASGAFPLFLEGGGAGFDFGPGEHVASASEWWMRIFYRELG